MQPKPQMSSFVITSCQFAWCASSQPGLRSNADSRDVSAGCLRCTNCFLLCRLFWQAVKIAPSETTAELCASSMCSSSLDPPQCVLCVFVLQVWGTWPFCTVLHQRKRIAINVRRMVTRHETAGRIQNSWHRLPISHLHLHQCSLSLAFRHLELLKRRGVLIL